MEKEKPTKAAKLAQAVLFGLIFGFLLQKGGVGKYHVLEGQLLLQDFTVLQVMITAVLVGMIGIYCLHKKAGTELQIVLLRSERMSLEDLSSEPVSLCPVIVLAQVR